MRLNPTNRWKRVTEKNLDAFARVLDETPKLEWHTPPENQGQFVQVSYAFLADDIIARRTFDRSDRHFDFAFRLARETDEPWSREPR